LTGVPLATLGPSRLSSAEAQTVDDGDLIKLDRIPCRIWDTPEWPFAAHIARAMAGARRCKI